MWRALIYVCDEFSPVEVAVSVLLVVAERDLQKAFSKSIEPFVWYFREVTRIQVADAQFGRVSF